MKTSKYNYPLHFLFRITTFSNDFSVNDAQGKKLFYVREKMFKFRDHIKVFRDDSKREELYDLVSNKIIDFQQTFTITDNNNQVVGKVRKKTFQSFVTVTYHIQNPNGVVLYTIKERSALVRFFDNIFGEIPIVGYFSGYIFNPKYVVKDQQGKELYELKKQPSFFGRKFTVDKLNSEEVNEEQIILSLMLMILQQRDRG